MHDTLFPYPRASLLQTKSTNQRNEDMNFLQNIVRYLAFGLTLGLLYRD